MSRHRFINDGRSPIPMGSRAEYACVCGKRGARDTIERHIAENTPGSGAVPEATPTARYAQVDVDGGDFGGGDTKAHYLPLEPRRPAPTGESLPLERPESRDRAPTPDPLPPPPSTAIPAVAPRSIAELFQDMLRSAFQAGTAAAISGESFETWYQREVLR